MTGKKKPRTCYADACLGHPVAHIGNIAQYGGGTRRAKKSAGREAVAAAERQHKPPKKKKPDGLGKPAKLAATGNKGYQPRQLTLGMGMGLSRHQALTLGRWAGHTVHRQRSFSFSAPLGAKGRGKQMTEALAVNLGCSQNHLPTQGDRVHPGGFGDRRAMATTGRETLSALMLVRLAVSR